MTIDLSDYEAGGEYQGDYGSDLADLQERIARLLVSLHLHGRRAIVVAEGWDAAGKGGAIQRMTAKCDPRHYKVWPIAAPSEGEKARHYLWRFWNRLPRDGELAIFDRSWYGRVLVERVEGLAGEDAWRRAYDEINEFEAQQISDRTLIVKLFFHVTEQTQRKRIEARLGDPWKRWKVTAEDFRNIRRRDDYLAAMKDMFRETDTRWAPWTAIDANDKKAARIAALGAVAKALAGHVPAKPPKVRPEMEQAAQDFLEGRGGSA
ncbi:polyphosphate kinase [Sphingosinicella sp. YJ22]|uniref:polyphosphate kinase 2 family protein n=1 Tax=Sphingosinicella sp. YJ22 TaxID=1104780 RepID=UPI00140A418B|nr:polyphosphate kinase [Sphingosinicella sp. YJ22]